ncbi:MAG: cytochrome c maturation protein CcmE [Acidiferrobacterales bacterium]
MKRRYKRLVFVSLAFVGVAVAAVLVVNSLRSNTAYFFSPSRVLAKEAPVNRLFRLGGIVKKGSVKRTGDGLTVEFIVTDLAADVLVRYRGILPDLFAEEKSVVTKGKLQAGGLFLAEEVLAKHDEKYVPPEVVEAMERAKKIKAGKQ